MNKVNSWSEFQPLEEIIIGSTFPPEFYNDVKNTKIKDCLQRIAIETEEDLPHSNLRCAIRCGLLEEIKNVRESLR